ILICYLVVHYEYYLNFFFQNKRPHTKFLRDWSSDVCSSDLATPAMRDGSSSAASEGVSSSATRMQPSGKSLRLRNGVAVRLRMRSEERRVGKEDEDVGIIIE